MAEQQVNKIGFKSMILFKDQTLGIGSYGAVCKAKCDDLVCAAKIIHPTLLDPLGQLEMVLHREHRQPIRRFEQECEFLSNIRHPNIVLYLGMHQDRESGLPVLLMELMDENLTHFLESSTQPIPYHIQVNICHDIALALSFLHSNKIIHRDLSSNNVLLRGNLLAKVTDFGMARLSEGNRGATTLTNTVCPGTDAYMPPEAVDEGAVYTEKIDCFSFGVIVLQMLTRLFPKPGDRVETINDPRYPRAIKMNIPEIERRQEHVKKVDADHPLLPVVMDCLKDEERERPSAEQLCERMAALKESGEYRDAGERGQGGGNEQVQDSQEAVQDQSEANAISLQQKDAPTTTREQELRECREENQRLRKENEQLSRKNERVNEDIKRLEIHKNQTIQEKEMRFNRVNYQLEESERVIADFKRRVIELEEQVRQSVQTQYDDDRSAGAAGKTSIELRWRKGEKAPCDMDRSYDAVIQESAVHYVHQEVYSRAKVYTYNCNTSKWSLTPPCPIFSGFAIVVISGTLTAIGGREHDWNDTNKLFSLTDTEEGGEKSWAEEFPPMPTKRRRVSALCTGTALIVVGGVRDTFSIVKTVEVLNASTRQWHSATELPQPLYLSSMAVCGDRVYLLGGRNRDGKWTNSVYTYSLTTLSSVHSHVGSALSQSSDTWTRVADLPVSRSTALSLHGHLIAVGGMRSNLQCSSDIHRYNPSTNSWEVISHMAKSRSGCLAAVLPNNQLMVVGGFTKVNEKTNSVEFGATL